MGLRPIIVLGAERSGTSAVAELIHSWGAFSGGPATLPVADDRNPRGRWEYQPLWDLLVRVGDLDKGTSWWDESFPDHIAAKLNDPNATDHARRLVAEMEVAKRPWVWKDPALCHYLPFWMQVWTDPVVVVCTRHPIDIAVSWRHFCSAEGVSTSVACNLMRWQHMLRSVLIGTKAVTDKLFVSYEALISGRTSEIDRLVAFLDTALDRDTPVAKRLEMDEVVDPSLRRVATNGECLTSVMCDSQADLFALLQRKVVDASAPFSEQDYPMPTRWRTDVLAQEAAIREL